MCKPDKNRWYLQKRKYNREEKANKLSKNKAVQRCTQSALWEVDE